MNTEPIGVYDLTAWAILPFVFWIITEVISSDNDFVTPFLTVCQFINGIRYAVGLNNQEEWCEAATNLQQPSLTEPITGIDDWDFGQVLVVEFAGRSDLRHEPVSKIQKLECWNW